MPVTQIPSTTDKAIVVGTFPTCSPGRLFDYWTIPQLITQWWPPEAEIESCLNGSYHFSWPQMQWHLRGQYTDFEPGRKLAFTWRWDHYPNITNVVVNFEPLDAIDAIGDTGTKLTVTHGDYSDSGEDQEARQGHIEGWLYFVGKLQSCIEGQ